MKSEATILEASSRHFWSAPFSNEHNTSNAAPPVACSLWYDRVTATPSAIYSPNPIGSHHGNMTSPQALAEIAMFEARLLNDPVR